MGYKSGELYILGELDPVSGARTPFVKIGIVKDSEDRDTAKRIKEHQTGNPREITELHVFSSPNVEDVETALHGIYAPIRIGGEWFHCDDATLTSIVGRADETVAVMRTAEQHYLAAEELKDVESSDDRRDPTSDEVDLGRESTSARAAIKLAKGAEKAARDALKAAHDRGRDARRFVEVQKRNARASFDEAAFAEAHPKIHASLTAPVTKVKGKFVQLSTKGVDHTLIAPEIDDVVSAVGNAATTVSDGAGDVAELHSLYLELLSMLAPLTLRDAVLKAEVQARCGTAAGINGVCTWNRALETELKFDRTALKSQRPELHARFMTTKETAPAVVPVRHLGYRL